ncbi:helix-turn-helix domain-containing protein [Streptomyces sp. NPDC037389]|uniref:helix-turn-helix domain-containing protein n=1 Tax=Streptomyces sp. NPDC037389 TaxID=3155369 RepID=UPI0033F4ECC5
METPSALSTTEQRLHSVKSASRILNIGSTRAYEEIRRGRLRTVRSGRRRLVPTEYIEEYIELLKNEAASAA